MKSTIVELRGLVLPNESGLMRRHVRKPDRITEHYLARYDRQTLIYDCYYDPSSSQYVITAPRFFNLWPLIKDHLFINAQNYRGKIKRKTYQKYEQLYIAGPTGQRLEIRSPEYTAQVDVRESLQSLFKGQNTMFSMNKNNDLEWLYQWAQFHRNAHGLEGVVVVDNGSSNYTGEDIILALERVEGLKSVAVVQADYPYGPVDANGRAILSPRFLQTAMFNLVKNDMFKQARAVLNMDVDELAVPNGNVNVFDAAANSKLGAVSFREQKIHPSQSIEKAYPQRDHSRIRAAQKPGNTKWCVAGNGFINRFSWGVHRFAEAIFPLTETKAFTYYHCQSATIGWKKGRLKQPENLIEDEKIIKVMQQFLPE